MSAAATLRSFYDNQMEQYGLLKTKLQAACPHLNVLHDGGFRSYGTYNAQRRCADCGLTETGEWWQYSLSCQWLLKDTFKQGLLAPKEGRTITEVDDKTFNGAYIP